MLNADVLPEMINGLDGDLPSWHTMKTVLGNDPKQYESGNYFL